MMLLVPLNSTNRKQAMEEEIDIECEIQQALRSTGIPTSSQSWELAELLIDKIPVIDAAYDLLESLKSVILAAENGWLPDGETFYHARAAIKKATNQSN